MIKVLLRAAFAALALVPSFLLAQTLNFSVASATTGGATITPRLTWSTSPAATSCTATGGSSGWAGAKGPSGVQTLTAISQSETYTLACSWPSPNGTVSFQWTPPTQFSDGTTLTPAEDLKWYLIHFGTTTGAMTQTRRAEPPTISSTSLTDIPTGTYYFCIRAVGVDDRLSECSNTVQKSTSTAGQQTITRTAGLVFVKPNAPTGFQ